MSRPETMVTGALFGSSWNESNQYKMEKFYITRLSNVAPRSDRLSCRPKFVDIELPPSGLRTFGLVCLVKRSLELSVLQPGEVDSMNKGAGPSYSVERLINLDLVVVDFDVTTNSICIADNSLEQNRKQLQCILLAQHGDILKVDLTLAKVELLISSRDHALAGKFVGLKLQQEVDREQKSTETIHLWTERRYTSLLIQFDGKIIRSSSYAVEEETWPKLVQVHLSTQGDLNCLVILELSDRSLRVVRDSICLTVVSLFEQADLLGSSRHSPDQHILLSGSTRDFLLLSASGSSTKLVGHAIRVGPSDSQDPDNLLVREPTFELERCWSIDLDAVQGMGGRMNVNADSHDEGYVLPIFQEGQPSDWIKYFVTLRRQSLQVFSFSQVATNPFATIYDSSSTPVSNAKSPTNDDLIDPKVKPRLLLNTRLTGTSSGDLLFNSLLMKPDVQAISIRYLSSIGLLVMLLSSGDIIAFRFTSSKIDVKSNAISDYLIRSIRNSSFLLRNLRDKLKAENTKLISLQQDLSSGSANLDMLNLSNTFHVDLINQNDDPSGCLYNLLIEVSNLLLINKILIVSTVNCHLLNPVPEGNPESLARHQINNSSSHRSALIFSNLKVENLSDLSNVDIELQSPNEQVQAWSIIDLEELSDNYADKLAIKVPLFILDGQNGAIQVYCLSQSHKSVADPRFTAENSSFRYYSEKLIIRPLLSYQICQTFNAEHFKGVASSIEVEGVDRGQLIDWLGELMSLEKDSVLMHLNSTLTNSFITIQLKDSKTLISSNDILALDLIKRHLLKRATDGSLRLMITPLLALEASLRHLVASQFLHFQNFSSKALTSNDTKTVDHLVDRSITLETLVSELQQIDLPIDVDQMRRDFENDINLIQPIDESKQEHNKDEALEVYRDFVSNYLTDLLVDYERMRSNKVNSEKMSKTRDVIHRMLSGKDNRIKPTEDNEASFVELLLAEWNDQQ